MKRYFLVADANMPALGALMGEWHSIDLGSHGAAGAGHHAVVMLDPTVDPPASWVELPELVDARTTLENHGRRGHAKLADVGVVGTHTTLDVARKLAEKHRAFRP